MQELKSTDLQDGRTVKVVEGSRSEIEASFPGARIRKCDPYSTEQRYNVVIAPGHAAPVARHDSKILSDWLPMGGGRAAMMAFLTELEKALDRQGYGRDACQAHSGRRDYTSTDRLSVTSPAGWGTAHDGSATIKARGCTFYRQAVRALAPAIAAGMGITYNGLDARGEYVGNKRANA